MAGLVRDIITLRDEREQRLIGTGKGQEQLVRSRTPSGAVYDLRLCFLQKVIVPHQEIDVLDPEFDRKNSAVRRWVISEPMVDLIEPEKRRLADPIADAAVEQRRPQRLARRYVLTAKCDALQANDAGISRR